jgi:hypothetical protein
MDNRQKNNGIKKKALFGFIFVLIVLTLPMNRATPPDNEMTYIFTVTIEYEEIKTQFEHYQAGNNLNEAKERTKEVFLDSFGLVLRDNQIKLDEVIPNNDPD